MAAKQLNVGGITWLAITKPAKSDLKQLRDLHDFHEVVRDYVKAPTLHPALEEYDDHLFLILHFPLINPGARDNTAVEIDFLLTKKTLVTITYRTYPRLEAFFKACEEKESFQRRFFHHNTGFLLAGILEYLLQALLTDLDDIEQAIQRIEARIFRVRDESIVEDISHLRRDVIDFRRIFLSQDAVFHPLSAAATTLLGREVRPYFANLLATHNKLDHLIQNHRETVEALHHTHESLVANRISKIITVLTIFSAIILPLNLVSSIWGMNHAHLPLRDGPWDFWIVMGIMVLVGALLLATFKKIRWL